MIRKIILSAILMGSIFTACTNSESKTDQSNAEVLPPTREVIDTPPPRPNPYWVTIDSMGKITFAGQSMTIDKLEKTLTDSLIALKRSGQPMPDTIMYETRGTVMMGIRGAVGDAINDARAAAQKVKQ